MDDTNIPLYPIDDLWMEGSLVAPSRKEAHDSTIHDKDSDTIADARLH